MKALIVGAAAAGIAAATPAYADKQPQWMIETVRCMTAPPVAYKRGEHFEILVKEDKIDAYTPAALEKLKACFAIAMQNPRALELVQVPAKAD
jgi:hypothetical protein